jgi:hypothetical protein
MQAPFFAGSREWASTRELASTAVTSNYDKYALPAIKNPNKPKDLSRFLLKGYGMTPVCSFDIYYPICARRLFLAPLTSLSSST